jgi:hypothetical protein
MFNKNQSLMPEKNSPKIILSLNVGGSLLFFSMGYYGLLY